MSGFLVSIILSLVFFVSKLVFNIYNLFNKKQVYDNRISKYASDLSFIFYLLTLIALVLSLRLAGDYGNGEVNLTIIVVAIVAVLYVVENVKKYAKNRDYLVLESNFYDFKTLVKKQEFKDILLQSGTDFYLVRKENLDVFKGLLNNEESVKKSAKKITIEIVKAVLPIILCVVILVIGIVREA